MRQTHDCERYPIQVSIKFFFWQEHKFYVRFLEKSNPLHFRENYHIIYLPE